MMQLGFYQSLFAYYFYQLFQTPRYISSLSGKGKESHTGPLILAVLGYGQESRHSMPQSGHFARWAPKSGLNLQEQA
jgi:hypothetical protein